MGKSSKRGGVTASGSADSASQSASVEAARIENIGFLISDVTRLMRTGFDRRVREVGLTRPQWRVLVYVLQTEGLSQSALAKAMDIGRAPVGQLLRALESLDLIRRERSPTDQREWLIFAGGAARGVVPELIAAAEWLRGVYFQGLSKAEIDQLHRLLERMRANLTFELDR